MLERSHAQKWAIVGAVALGTMLALGVGVGVGVGVGLNRAQARGSSSYGEEQLMGAPGVPHRQLVVSRAVRTRPSIVVVGDGLTESGFNYKLGGWGALLTTAYIRKADVINRGFGGYFSNWFKDYMLDSLFNVANPEMGIMFLGVKDSQVAWAAGKAYTPPEKFAANLDAIIKAGKAAGIKYWLLVTPPPVYESKKIAGHGPRTPANTQLYVDQIEALGKKYGAPVVNIFETWSKEAGWADKYLQQDKLHLNPDGNKRLYEDVMAKIRTALPEMDPAKMAWQFPGMDVIDRENPGPAFANVSARR